VVVNGQFHPFAVYSRRKSRLCPLDRRLGGKWLESNFVEGFNRAGYSPENGNITRFQNVVVVINSEDGQNLKKKNILK
jgi:hypothetical protein